MLQRAASNAYSWWWASHIRTKQSKWLEQNHQDMEERIDNMIQIIEGAGDSFAKRAEMYYRKRPELLEYVEQSFRAYRALAERYDHLSRELQSANRTIATVFPEQAHYGFDDDDDENSRQQLPSGKPEKLFKDSSDAAKNIPKVPEVPMRDMRSPSMMLPKRKQLQRTCRSAKVTIASSSGLSKDEALEEIDKFQKRILALQTEKEFVKCLYEHNYSRYWEIEDQITDKQEKVTNLQDEFGIGTVIEDDEARSLMASTALKSCQAALAKLHERHQQSSEEAKLESQKIKEADEKVQNFKDEFLPNNVETQESTTAESKDTGEGIHIKNQEKHDLEIIRKKITGDLEINSSNSLSVTQLTETIDELVDKVVNLETEVSSQATMVKQLKSETDDLQACVRNLEEDKEALRDDSESMKKRLKELEEELRRVKKLDENFKEQNNQLQTEFTETSCKLDHLNKKLPTMKLREDIDDTGLVSDKDTMPAARGDTQEQEDKKASPDATPVSNIVESEGMLPDDYNKDRPEISADGNQYEEDGSKAESELRNNPDAISKATHETVQHVKGENYDPAKGEEIEVAEEKHASFDTSIVSDEMELDEQKKDRAEISACGTKKEEEESQAHYDEGDNPDVISDATRETVEHDRGENHDLADMQGLQEEGNDSCSKVVFSNGLEDREKLLMNEYTSVCRKYNEVKKELSDVVSKNKDALIELAIQIRELQQANSLKDQQIQSLSQQLNSSQTYVDENPETSSTHTCSHHEASHGSITEAPFSPRSNYSTLNRSESLIVLKELENSAMRYDKENRSNTVVEAKFRSEIDGLLEENLAFWLRFSTAFQQVQKFQSSTRDLNAELSKLKQEGRTRNHSLESDIRPIYRHLREIQAELTVWLESNTALKDELQGRFSSLSDIKEEISKTANEDPGAEGPKLSQYQAAKFQGELLNMEQENKKIANELQTGLDRVRGLQNEIEKTLEKLDNDLRNAAPKTPAAITKNSSKPRIPLRSFLFGAKLKKQRQRSLLACVNPTLNEPYSEMDPEPY